MDEWYYTKNNQQMGPVSWDELKQLADSGVLKPSDMVWKEGLVNWVKAEKREGLFAPRKPVRSRVEEDVDKAPRRRSARDEGDDADDDRPRRRRDEDDELDDDDRPRRRRREAASTGMPLGAKVAIIGGSVAVGLLVIIVVIILIARSAGSPPGSYTVPNLGPLQKHMATFTFRAGQKVNIRVTSTVTHPATDVDLLVERLNGQRIAADTLISKDCNVTFELNATEQLRLNVVNLGPGNATCVVNVN
jgi:hypothetical protein